LKREHRDRSGGGEERKRERERRGARKRRDRKDRGEQQSGKGAIDR